jgi:putative ABC transport system ATP-binding protein
LTTSADLLAESAVTGPSVSGLIAQEVSRTFGPVTALRPTTLAINAGERVAVVGPSGAGKSTLLHLLAAMDRPSGGRVLAVGQDLAAASDEELAAVRRQFFEFVFQSGRLIPYLSAADNVALPMMLAGTSRATALGRSREVLARLGIEKLVERRPNDMSGGEAQRVAIARAVAHEPEVVFADEPTGNLDSQNAEFAFALLLEATERRTLVLVTHDDGLAKRLPRRIELRDGAVVNDQIARS